MSKGKSAIFWELRKSIGQHKFSTRPDGEIIGSMKGKKDPTYKDPAKRAETGPAHCRVRGQRESHPRPQSHPPRGIP